jgi:hypothetical protein
VPFIEPEPQRPHEPQLRTSGDARPADVSGVLRNVGLMQDDVEERARGVAFANDEILNPNV